MTSAVEPEIVVTAAQLWTEQGFLEKRWHARVRVRWLLPEPGHQLVDPARLRKHIGAARALVVGDDVIDSGILARAGRLELVVKWGVGVDAIDREALADHSIRLRNTPGLFGEEVADVAIAYLTMLTRGLVLVHDGVRQGSWPKPKAPSTSALTVAVIGGGTVGQSVIARLAGRVKRIYVVDPAPEAASRAETLGAEPARWPDVLAKADVLILCRPAAADGLPVLTARTIEMMRQGGYVINVARGSLVDEPALAAALQSGHLAGAALDTYVVEPLPRSSVLRAAPNLIFGAHNGSYTSDAIARTNRKVVEILESELGF